MSAMNLQVYPFQRQSVFYSKEPNANFLLQRIKGERFFFPVRSSAKFHFEMHLHYSLFYCSAEAPHE